MASTIQNKNIFSAFGMEDVKKVNTTKGAHGEAIQTITGSKNSSRDDFTVVKHKKSPPKQKTSYKKSTSRAPSTPVSTKEQKIISKMDDFPALGTKLTKEQTKAIKTVNLDAAKVVETKVTKQRTGYVDQRTACFEAMADKEKVAKSLTCTKACRLVTAPYLKQVELNKTLPEDERKEPTFGVCTRLLCTFAHSDLELQPPMCGFDGNCRFLHGKRDRKTRKPIPNTQCRFRHSSETVDGWRKRSGVMRTPLPETNEHSRKPVGAKPSAPVKIAPPPVTSTKAPTSATVRRVRKKSRWDEKPKEAEEAEAMRLMVNMSRSDANTPPIRSESDSDSSSSCSSSSESSSSESDDESKTYKERSRRNSHRSATPPRRVSLSRRSLKVIEVPTKELAAIALKAAIERGEYGVRVMVV